MNWFIENWSIIIGAVAVVAVLVAAVVGFFKLPVAMQKTKVKEWLLYAVTEAERILGSGTGKLKLELTFEMMVTHFPLVSKLISFETFSEWVDDALDRMRKLLDTNENINHYVNGGYTDEEN